MTFKSSEEKMSESQYAITLDSERGLVHIIAHGELAKAAGEEIITTARTIAAEHQYDILCDVRQARVRAAFVDWYFLPRRLAVYKNKDTRAVRTAILITPGKQEKVYQFFETVTRNLGMRIRIFLQEEEALAWLEKIRLDR